MQVNARIGKGFALFDPNQKMESQGCNTFYI